ncbi:MAG: hypothetical protein JSW58_06555 [Candidatus Latescibacterota bacterium]|nr:MAG: hypothetical protein JSW58_06555 [Candidatus Latescibacterota bacterium]
MTSKTVPISDSIKRGWGIYKENVFLLIAVFVIATIVYAIIERAETMGERLPWPVEMLIAVGYLIAFAIVEIGIINVTLKFIDDGKAEFEHLVSEIPVLIKFVVALLLYGLMVGVGLLVLVFPGIYLAIKFGFFGYCVVDDKLEPLDALRASSKLTDGVKLDLFLFYLFLILIFVLGFLCFLVGVYVSWPVTRLAVADVYRHLRGQVEGPAGGEAAAAG